MIGIPQDLEGCSVELSSDTFLCDLPTPYTPSAVQDER